MVKNAVPFLALFPLLAAQGAARPVFAQAEGGAPSAEARQAEAWNKSLRRAALQLAAASLAGSDGGIAPPLRLPQKIVVLPLIVERASGRGTAELPVDEPVLRARFVDCLKSARYGDVAVFAPLSARETARIARLTPNAGAGKNAKSDKTLDAARKAGADYVLRGTLSPAPGKAWLLTVALVGVSRGGGEIASDAPALAGTVKATVSGTLRFTDVDRQ